MHGFFSYLTFFFTKCKNFLHHEGSTTSRYHHNFISLQTRKITRSNYWRPIIAKEESIVLALAWYISVELLRTKQLPQYITYAGIDRVPRLKVDIRKQASSIYTNVYRKDDIVNKFFIADTGQNHLDGKVGVITSYDTVNCRFVAKVRTTRQSTSSESTDIHLSPVNMEPYKRVYTATHLPRPSAETCKITLANHFAMPVSALPSVTFQSGVFSEIGGITGSPHTGGQALQDRLVDLIERNKAIAKKETDKIQAQQVELEKGLSRLYSTRVPVESRPRNKVRQIYEVQNEQRKLQIKARALQIKSVWKAKIEHIISKSNLNQGVDQNDKDDHEHMFTYPFRTVDNSLHWSSEGLSEFSHHSGTDSLNDAVYGRNNIASSIIIDEKSVSSVTPGHDMDDDMMNFCLSW